MITAAEIKFIKSLKDKSARYEAGIFIVEGEKMVKELLQSGCSIHQILGVEQWVAELDTSESSQQIPVTLITEKELWRISQLKHPNKVLALAEIPERSIEKISIQDTILMFEDISDPGNLGSMIRIADWFGIHQIICSENSVDVYNPKTVQASMGSVFRVAVYYTPLAPWLEQQHGQIYTYATALNGTPVKEVDKKSPSVILFGNESKGLSDPLLKLSDTIITIPKFEGAKNNRTESLNVAMSAAIICNEWRR
jgi:TrmH family RNA methyltransferase